MAATQEGTEARKCFKNKCYKETVGRAFCSWSVRGLERNRTLEATLSVSELMMGRDLPVCEKLHLRTEGHFLNYVPHRKNLEEFECPIIILSKDFRSLEKSPSSEDKAESWYKMICRPSGATTCKTCLLLFWTSLHELRYTSINHCL